MEAFLFAILIATLLTRKGLADIPFMVRGKTPPSHERRMAEMRQREAARDRRHQRRMAKTTRPRGAARSYAAALWEHSWQQAAERRRVKWQHRDPAKADAYARKIQAKLDGTHRGPLRRVVDHGKQLHAKAKTVAGGFSAPSTVQGEQNLTETPTPVVSAAAEPAPGGDAAAEAPSATEPDIQWPDADDAKLAGAIQLEDAAERYGYLDADDRRTCSTCKTWATPEHVESPEHQAALDRAAHQYDHDTAYTPKRGTTMTTAPSEAIGVEAFAAALEQHREAAESGTPALEGLIASAQQQQVGPSVTDPLAQAQELYSQFVAKIDEAQQGIQQSINVGESYSANPDAGDAAFVTNGARS